MTCTERGAVPPPAPDTAGHRPRLPPRRPPAPRQRQPCVLFDSAFKQWRRRLVTAGVHAPALAECPGRIWLRHPAPSSIRRSRPFLPGHGGAADRAGGRSDPLSRCATRLNASAVPLAAPACRDALRARPGMPARRRSAGPSLARRPPPSGAFAGAGAARTGGSGRDVGFGPGAARARPRSRVRAGSDRAPAKPPASSGFSSLLGKLTFWTDPPIASIRTGFPFGFQDFLVLYIVVCSGGVLFA